MRYTELIEYLLRAVPEIKDEYEQYMKWCLEERVNLHMIFKDVLCPFLNRQLETLNNKGLIYRIFSLFEQMALSSDYKVQEVLVFTCFYSIKNIDYYAKFFMGKKTKEIYHTLLTTQVV